MKKSLRKLRKLSIGILILFTGICLLSTNVLAAELYPPYLDYVGDFTYNDGSGGSPSERYLLDLYNMDVTQVIYINNTYISDSANPYGLDFDPVLDAYLDIGNLYNDVYPNNLIFSNTQPSGGSTGPVTFEIKGSGIIDPYTGTYLTATLDYFEVTYDALFGTRLNPGYNLNNIYDITFDPNSNAPFSRYISELETVYNNDHFVNLFIDFTFNSGNSDFTNDSYGTIQGQIATTPEPVSSILFVTGGATLAFRRYWKRKRKCNS